MPTRQKHQVLFVDDEPGIVKALVTLMKVDYDARSATSASQALQMVNEMPHLAVVVSDMHMPEMDGATFLHEIMLRRPDVTRILLTGDAGRDIAVDAVNKGQIFRFLTKPVAVKEIQQAVEAGDIQYRLVHAERAVLQETLIGCIKALMEVLAIASPAAFGRAERVKRVAMACAARFGCADYWQLEAAALLSQVGYVALPPPILDKLQMGKILSAEEVQQVGVVPGIANKLLDHIPRLEPVIQILVALTWPDARVGAMNNGTIGLGAKILGAVLEYEAQCVLGKSPEAAFDHLRTRAPRYGEKVIDVLENCMAAQLKLDDSMEVALRNLRPGMVMLEETRAQNGTLVIPRGAEVTKAFLQRIEHAAPELLDSRVRVRLLASPAA